MLENSADLMTLVKNGGYVILPLAACSIVAWLVIFERLWAYRKLTRTLRAFHQEAVNSLLSAERSKGREILRTLCARHAEVPTSRIAATALDRLEARDPGLKRHWAEAAERRRQQVNQELKQGLWILGSIGSASPFIGLFGTVVGILQAFRAIATTGSGGFGVVAAGISEALIATALGVVIAVIAVMAYNALQTRSAHFVFLIRQQTEELLELLGAGD